MTKPAGEPAGLIPQPETTSRGQTFEGRPLARPHDEVVDQGAAFDVTTVINRRRAIKLLGLGAGALALAACAAQGSPSSSQPPIGGSSMLDTPDEIAGPFPGDGSNGIDVLDRSGIVRRDITSSIGGGRAVAGVPLVIALTVTDAGNGGLPVSDAAVYVWQCDSRGGYSMYSPGLETETYLRGVQQVDSSGTATFTSVFPGCYPGRWPHVHFEVYPRLESVTGSEDPVLTSQLALPEGISREVYGQASYGGSLENLDELSLATDIVFGEDSAILQTANVTGSPGGGLSATLEVRLGAR
jgi:protocatechuate 3,4-dioxygenase beta subunit